MTIRSGYSNKDNTRILNFFQYTFSFHKHFGTELISEKRTAKSCTEVSVMPKHLITKLYILMHGSTPYDCFITKILQNN